MPYSNSRHTSAAFKVWRFSVKRRGFSGAGLDAGQTFSLKLAIGRSKRLRQKPHLKSSVLLRLSVMKSGKEITDTQVVWQL